MTDTTFTIHTKSNGALSFDGAIGDSYPTFGAGKSASVTVYSRQIDDADLDTLREFARYTNDGTLSTEIRLNGRPLYEDSIPPQSSLESLLVRIEPGADVTGLESWWAVIEDAQLVTTSAGTGPRVTLELFALGRVAEYADRQLAEDAFETGFRK